LSPLTLEQIRIATNGKLINANLSALIQFICTDTRELQPGCLFIALTGENHDGHHHVETAAKGRALAAMVHDDCLSHLPLLKVVDTRKAMGRLGAYVRRELKGTVIAVAGSNGKTGTKNLIHSALKNVRTGTISPKSFNNDIGVPTTIFAASSTQDYLVLEVGTNHPGEILNLTQIAQPDAAVITNIGAEHLEFLGDLDGVTKENAQIIQSLNPDGLLVLNGDSPRLLDAVAGYPGKKITFGFGPQNDLRPTDIVCDHHGVHFKLNGSPISIPLMGRHTAVNAMAGIAVGRHLGVSDADLIAGLATAVGPEMRLQLQTAGSIRILNDAYNANPHSMQAGLETLRDMKSAGRKIAILADMKELGDTADRYHREIGEFAAACDLDHLVCVGEKARLIAEVLMDKRISVEHYDTARECAANISKIVREDDLVLLKGSRSMKLETVANSIMTMVAVTTVQREVSARMKAVAGTGLAASAASASR
jgi:UDP-N-acetylmuramoyl-tripeptide--D-alanyl-D-alanine ligase